MPERLELHLARNLDVAYSEALQVLQAGPERWLPEFRRDGDRITAGLALDRAGRRISRRVEVQLGHVQPFAYGVTVRIEWKGSRLPHLYPRLEGHLRLERGRPKGCRLSFAARYEPPAGMFGASVDRAVMYRIADATLNDFLDGVAGLLTGAEPAPPRKSRRSELRP